MRSMLAEIQERLDEGGAVTMWPDRPHACAAPETNSTSLFVARAHHRDCAACVIGYHAAAMQRPDGAVFLEDGEMASLAGIMNEITRAFELPLPLVPEAAA